MTIRTCDVCEYNIKHSGVEESQFCFKEDRFSEADICCYECMERLAKRLSRFITHDDFMKILLELRAESSEERSRELKG